jgi:hypothetical protein
MDRIDGVKRRRARGRPFQKGRSGNPAGRPAGAQNRKTLAAALLLDGEAEALTRKAVELALDGDAMALKLCLERILPLCRERAVQFALPAIDSAADIAAAMKAVAAAVAEGAITPGEGETVARILAGFAPKPTICAGSKRRCAKTRTRRSMSLPACWRIFNRNARVSCRSAVFRADQQTQTKP